MSSFPNESSPLDLYGQNLTLLARQGAFPPLAQYQAEVDKIFHALLRRERMTNFSNPVIIDASATTRWLIMVEAIRRMSMGEAPDLLSKRQVIALDFEALCANTSWRKAAKPLFLEKLTVDKAGSLEEMEDLDDLLKKPFWPPLEEWVAPSILYQRLQAIFLALRQIEDGGILLVDPLHRLLGGEKEQYPLDAFELLKPALARRQIQLIGGCTLEQWQYIEQDGNLEHRFQRIFTPDTRQELQQLSKQQMRAREELDGD